MFKIENQTIYLTRGDTAKFSPIIEDYEVQDGDLIVFTVKKVETDPTPAIRIEIAAEAEVELTHEDTVNLPSGDYVYDLCLHGKDGRISTFINGEKLVLLGELDNGRA